MTNSINSIKNSVKNSIKNSVANNANNNPIPDKFLNYKLALQSLSLFLVLYFYTYDIFQSH